MSFDMQWVIFYISCSVYFFISFYIIVMESKFLFAKLLLLSCSCNVYEIFIPSYTNKQKHTQLHVETASKTLTQNTNARRTDRSRNFVKLWTRQLKTSGNDTTVEYY